MKVFLVTLVSFISLFAYAGDVSPVVSKLQCASQNDDFLLLAVKQDCQDSRNQKWQFNGCYKVTINDKKQNKNYHLEMIRSLPFDKELLQKFYSWMTFNESEAVMQGILLEMYPANGQLAKFRFDTRDNDEGPFASYYGKCEVTH